MPPGHMMMDDCCQVTWWGAMSGRGYGPDMSLPASLSMWQAVVLCTNEPVNWWSAGGCGDRSGGGRCIGGLGVLGQGSGGVRGPVGQGAEALPARQAVDMSIRHHD